eukprot:jgi/Phyca11/20679/fgenesh1_pg.PHYCAscaffold_70_\
MDVLQTQATVTTPPATRVDPASSFDAWLLQKLRVEWSSREFGALLTPSKLAEARASFPHLESPIKVRLLLSLLSVRRDEAEAAAGKKEVDALLQLADNDAEEWVKADGQPADSYLHAQLEATASKVVQTVAVPPQRRGNSSLVALDDFYSLENGLLNPSLRPQLVPTAATHFTVSGEDDDVNGKEDELGASPVKKPLHRPQMARPSAGMAASTATTSAASTRLVQTVPKPPIGKKKNMTELSSEIRRKADAGRFKRQRSRISMIDINEVKQIESDKAQKAEERKKQKLAAKEKEKEKAKEKEKEKNAAAAVDASANAAENAGSTDGATVPVVVNEEHAAIAADIFAMHHQPGPDEGMQQYSQQQQLQTEVNTETTDVNQAADEDEYVPDGTQALLNAAFHSTQDIMKEVVSQQSHQIQDQQIQQQQLQQPAYQDLYRTQQQMQMHHLAPPQQQYHQGFEPEDASLNNTNTGGMPMGFGGFNYGTTAGYYGDQFGNYGAPQDTNAFGSGYSNSAMQQDNNMGLPPLGGRQLGFDPTQQQQQQQQQNNPYMGGSGEYWR